MARSLTSKYFHIAALLLLSIMTTPGFTQDKGGKTILFICEHGSAKSVVAAAHFNRIAEKEGLRVKAISRGTNPDAAVPDKINGFLNDDGFPNYTSKPIQLTPEDIKSADYVVAFSTIPTSYGNPGKIESWKVPSFEAGYTVSRDSIVHNIERIIKRIRNENQR